MTKQRYKLVPVDSLIEGDKFWCNGRLLTFTGLQWLFIISSDNGKSLSYEGQTHVWKQTSLPSDPGAQGGRRYADPMPLSWWYLNHLPGAERDPRLDEGKLHSRLMSWQGDGGTSDPVQSPAQPRATVRMTLGRDIKPGEHISCVVAYDDAHMCTYFHSGPFGARVLIEPHLYYQVVNDVTK